MLSTQQPSTVKHTLGGEGSRGAGTYVGSGVIALGGLVTLVSFLAMASGEIVYEEDQGGKKPDKTGPAVGIGLGLAAVATGPLLVIGDRPTHQPGATVQWLAGGAPEPRP